MRTLGAKVHYNIFQAHMRTYLFSKKSHQKSSIRYNWKVKFQKIYKRSFHPDNSIAQTSMSSVSFKTTFFSYFQHEIPRTLWVIWTHAYFDIRNIFLGDSNIEHTDRSTSRIAYLLSLGFVFHNMQCLNSYC